MLGGERDDGGGAAESGRHGGRIKIVGGHHAAGGKLLDMAVAVDAARQHVAAGGVEVARAGGQFFGEGGDLAGLDADVALQRVTGRHDGAVADG